MSSYEFHMRGKPTIPRFVLFLLATTVLVFADQAAKLAVAGSSLARAPYPVTSFFTLVHAHNTGAAFSLFSDWGGAQIIFFGLIGIVVSLVVLVALWRHNHRTLFAWALTLILAGAVGNLIDRIALGYVIDYLDFHWAGYHWPAFNIADICVCLGAALLILEEIIKTAPAQN